MFSRSDNVLGQVSAQAFRSLLTKLSSNPGGRGEGGGAEGVQDWSDHLKMNINLTIIGPTITLKIQGFDHK